MNDSKYKLSPSELKKLSTLKTQNKVEKEKKSNGQTDFFFYYVR